jgi:hypothetical protein
VHIEKAAVTAEGALNPGERDVSDELGRALIGSGIAREVQANGAEREVQADVSKPSRSKPKGVRWVAGKPRETKGDA